MRPRSARGVFGPSFRVRGAQPYFTPPPYRGRGRENDLAPERHTADTSGGDLAFCHMKKRYVDYVRNLWIFRSLEHGGFIAHVLNRILRKHPPYVIYAGGRHIYFAPTRVTEVSAKSR